MSPQPKRRGPLPKCNCGVCELCKHRTYNRSYYYQHLDKWRRYRETKYAKAEGDLEARLVAAFKERGWD